MTWIHLVSFYYFALHCRSFFDVSLMHELYRLCHGTAGRLHMLTEQNKALRGLIRGLIEVRDNFKNNCKTFFL